MSTLLFAQILGPDGIIVIVMVVVVLLFGGSRLPHLARGLGSAASEFRKGIAEVGEENDKAAGSADAKQLPATPTEPVALPEQASPRTAPPPSAAG